VRVAVGVKRDPKLLYPGPYGHSYQFAVYERGPNGWRLLELRDNPYKALEGGGKGRLLAELLADCDLWVGVQFGHADEDGGHHGHHHNHHHHDHEHGTPPEHVLAVPKGSGVEEALARAAERLAG